MKLNPYLTFFGNAEEALNFYQDALGGEISQVLNPFTRTLHPMRMLLAAFKS